MKSKRTKAWGAGAAMAWAVCLAAGCASTSAAADHPAGPPATADDENAVGLREHHRYHHHGGITAFIAMSVDTLGVSPEQRAAIDKIQAQLREAMAPPQTAEQDLLVTLADGLDASAIDAGKVDAAVARVGDAEAAVHTATAQSLNELHAVLTPAQRSALADKVEAHWAVWRRENGGPEEPLDAETSHLGRLRRELSLTPDQVAQIRAATSGDRAQASAVDQQKVAARVTAFGDAFRADTFDARMLGAGPDARLNLASGGAAHLAHAVEAMSPILTPDQRGLLAQKLRAHAAHTPGEMAGS